MEKPSPGRGGESFLAHVMWAGLVVGALGLTVLAGTYLQIAWLTTLGPGPSKVPPITALGFVAAGVSLFVHATRRSRRVAVAAAWVMIVSGAVILVARAGWRAPLRVTLYDILHVPHALHVPSTLPLGAVCLIAAGAGLVLTHERQSNRLASLFALVAALPPAVVIVSYVMETGRITESQSRPALSSAMGFLVVAVAIWWVQEDSTGHILLKNGPVAALLRRLFPVAVVGTVLFGWIRLIAFRHGLFTAEFSVALGIVETAALFVALMFWGARSLERTDSARREAADLTMKRESQLAEAQRIAHLGSFERDLRTGESEWSDEMFQILGYEPHEITPSFSRFRERIDVADRARVEGMISRAVETSSSFEEEFAIVRPSGERRAVLARGRILSDSDGRADRIHGAVLDVTDQRTVEAALKESEDRYRIIVEAAAEGIWTSNARGETTLINPRMAEMLGYEVDEIQELPLTAFLAGDGRELIRRVNARRLAGLVDRHEVELIRKDGSTLWVQVTANPMRSETGEFMGALALISDISARKKTEDALRAAYERESQALENARAVDEMKNAFLAAVSHELRTPLTGVLGFATTLHDRGHTLDEGDRDEMIERLLMNARRLDKLLSDLLDLDRLTRGILEPKRRIIQVEDLVHSVIDHGEHSTHRIKTDIEPGLSAYVDGPKVERIVENLINNAVRHTPLGTKIQVRAQSTDGGFMLSVDDEGPGIPDDEKEAIFEPFRTGSNSRPHSPGTGIGLSLVAHFAELHGGRCWVADRPGGGSTFAVFLPHGQVNEQDSGAA